MNDTVEFFSALWDGMPAGPAIQVWVKDDKRSHFYGAPHDAATFGSTLTRGDVYTCAGLSPKVLKPNKQRGSASDRVGIPGVWADIDVNGGPEDKTGAATDLRQALDFSMDLLEPTVIVNSGYGVQAWWLLENGPWIFSSDVERDRAADMVQGWQRALMARAKELGFGIDSTFDLARLMRFPGTINAKGGKEAVVSLITSGGPRYDSGEFMRIIEDLAPHLVESALGRAARTPELGEFVIDLGAQPNMDKFFALSENVPEFEETWKHKVRSARQRGWSTSEWDLSLASYAAQAGWPDQEIVDLLIAHRRKYKPADSKAERPDYFRKTLQRIRGNQVYEDEVKDKRAERDVALDVVAEAAEEEVVTDDHKAKIIAQFSKGIGGPNIKELIQVGLDPVESRFELVLESNQVVPIGPIDSLTDQKKFRNAFAVVTQFLPERMKVDRWDEVVRGLLKTSQLRENPEASRASRVLDWLEVYCDGNLTTDKFRACEVKAPFEEAGAIFISINELNSWIHRVFREKMSTTELKLAMESAGFVRKTVNYEKAGGVRSTRSYYTADKTVLP